MAKKSDDLPESIIINTKFFSKKWAEWNHNHPESKYNTSGWTIPDDWNEIHKRWRAFVLEITNNIIDFEDDEKNKPNQWMSKHPAFETDDLKFEQMSSRYFTKIRAIQKKLGEREGNDWKLVYKTLASGKKRIDWEQSQQFLPPVPYGMDCKNENPPKKKKSSSSTWGDIEKYFGFNPE